MARACSFALLLFFLWSRPLLAEAVYLECRYEQCVGNEACVLPTPLVVKFLFDTLFHKAYRLGAPAAHPVKQIESSNGIKTLVDERPDGSVYVTTIMAKGASVHSEHAFSHAEGEASVKPVFRQYYGDCHPVSRNAMAVGKTNRAKSNG